MALKLTASDQRSAANSVRDIIQSTGMAATLWRASTTGENLYGKDSAPYIQVGGEFPIELIPTPPEDLSPQGGNIDAVINVLPWLHVNPEDHVTIITSENIHSCPRALQDCPRGTVDNQQEYRVQTVLPQRLFGVTTHKTLKLVLLHGGE